LFTGGAKAPLPKGEYILIGFIALFFTATWH